MKLGPNEVQIVKGPGLIVTDQRIMSGGDEIAVTAVSAPHLEEQTMPSSAKLTVMAIGAVLLFGGLLVQAPPIWIVGGLTCAFAPLANIKRRALVLTVEMDGERRAIYQAPSLHDAKLGHAAIEEALRRSVA